MTCSDKTSIVVWSIKGDVLATLDNYQMETYCAKVSPCGRFMATSGFTPDVKVWEVKFNKSGFDKVQRAFELTGHKSGIFSFDFNSDSSRVVTLSKDNTWKLFNISVDYDRGQDPVCIQTCQLKMPLIESKSIIAISPDAKVVVVGIGTTLLWYNANTGEFLQEISHVHQEPFTSMSFDGVGNYLLTTGDKRMRVFYNVPGFKINVEELKVKLQKASSEGMKTRIKEQIADLETKLKNI